MAQVTREPAFSVRAELCPRVLALGRREHPHASFKRLADILISGALILALLPLFIACAIAIKLTSRGPVLYVSERVGWMGRKFSFLKFRTMVCGAPLLQEEVRNDHDEVIFKARRDPRITSVGRFLRRFSIDELPQLLHVFMGSMTLVGPRPSLPVEVEQYSEEDRIRLTVKPGLTCYWQVMGRSDLSFQEWMDLDRQYIREMSLLTDLKILAMTPKAVFSGRGAY